MEEWVKFQKDKFDELVPLVGHRVVSIHHYRPKDGAFDEGVFVVFDNGLILTARDGEYGDNAFELATEEEMKKKLNDTNEEEKWEKTV